jgi:hypothetical protein
MTNAEVIQMIIMTEAEKRRIVESYRDAEYHDNINIDYRDVYADMWYVVEDNRVIK